MESARLNDSIISLLDTVFSKPASRYERDVQRGLLVLEALYRTIRKSNGEPDKQLQEYAAITKWFCSKKTPSSTQSD